MSTPTSSGTTLFAPGIGELLLYAFGLCGVRRAALTQEHMLDARMAVNLLFAEWNNDTPNLWKVGLVSTPMVTGIASYTVDPATIMILDAYFTTTDTGGNKTDIYITPLSRTEYASLPNKSLQGRVTSYWFDRLLAPSITLWQVPDTNGPYTLNYYSVTRIFDGSPQSGQLPDIPNRWLSAFAFGLGAKLAHSYAPEHVMRLEEKAAALLTQAQEQDVENVPLFIGPQVGSYYQK